MFTVRTTDYKKLKEYLLFYYSEKQIFDYYSETILPIQKPVSSPLRTDDHPSFNIFYSKDDTLLYKDIATGECGDCIKFVSSMYNISYRDALEKIATDFSIETHHAINRTKYKSIRKVKKKSKFSIRIRLPDSQDVENWNRSGISTDVLNKYKINCCSLVYLNDEILLSHSPTNPIYSYCFHYKGEYYYKIYRPFNPTKNGKWFSNCPSDIWQGYDQLPDKGDILIITSSLKDVMSIVSTIPNLSAIAPQSETVMFNHEVIEELKKRFTKIYILFDNDYTKEFNWGQINANNRSLETGFENICIEDKYESTDYSELVENVGKEKASNILLSYVST